MEEANAAYTVQYKSDLLTIRDDNHIRTPTQTPVLHNKTLAVPTTALASFSEWKDKEEKESSGD
jgi:hypothetical protein